MRKDDYMRERMISIEHIAQLAKVGRSCYHAYSGRMPAAVLLNMRASLLLAWIARGELSIYPKQSNAAATNQPPPKKRVRCAALPNWCIVGQMVYWDKSGQNHMITAITRCRIWLTPGADYPGNREWCNHSKVCQLKPVRLIEDGAK